MIVIDNKKLMATIVINKIYVANIELTYYENTPLCVLVNFFIYTEPTFYGKSNSNLLIIFYRSSTLFCMDMTSLYNNVNTYFEFYSPSIGQFNRH